MKETERFDVKLVDQLRDTLVPYRGSRLVVAVSGGLDSVVLLDLLLQVRDELALELVVAHVDHGLRRGSAKHAKFVAKLAAGYGLPFHVTELDLPAAGNTEAVARDARYEWLEKIRIREKAAYVVTAHQADDQVETLLLHLARGSGLAGMAGMQMETGKLLRPLLEVPRKTLTRYARRRKLAYRLDPTNRNVRLARNRVRRQIITSLQKINPQLVETVTQSMRVFSDDYQVLQSLAQTELKKTTRSSGQGRLELDAARLKRLKRGLRHVVWREAVRNMLGNLTGFKLRNMENLDDLLNKQAGSRIHLPQALVVHRRSTSMMFKIDHDTALPSPGILPVPGTFKFADVVLSATDGGGTTSSNNEIIVDAELIEKELEVRPPKSGDRFKPVGMRGSKLISDLLTDAKVPRDERPWVPVVTTKVGDIVWVAGYRADRRFVAQEGHPDLRLSIK